MKNVTIKKLSAAALAAVMAVSFAPAASLNVFANPANKDAVGNETIDATGSYTLVSSTAVTVNSTATGTVNIDLNGQNVTVTIASGNKANVALYDTDGIRDTTKAGDVRYATLTVSGESNTPSLSISGNVNTKAVNPTGLKGTDNVAATGTQPVALIGGVYYVGNKAINTATDGQNISAVNGAVVIDELDDGKSATIVSGANHDTSIKVTATPSKVSLTDIKTTYTYYTGTSSRTGSGSYTADAWYAGDSAKAVVEGLMVPTTGSIIPASGEKVYSIPSYARAITVSMNGDSWTGTISKTGDIDSQQTDAATERNHVFGLTYFTADPSAYTTGTVAAIDSNKYVLGTNKLKAVTKESAKTSVKVIRGNAYTSADGNKNSTDTFTVNSGVTVSGPADETVVENIATDVQGNTTTVTKAVQVFGTAKAADATDFTKPSGTVSKRNVNVAQVAQGATVDFTSANEVTVSRGSGVGYYSYPSSTTETKYSFGPTTVITNAFRNFVAPHTSNGLTIPAVNDTIKAATVFASKEIKTTVSGVAKTVTIKGETSAKVTATSGNTQTWEVNADAKTTVSPVATYRLYDRNRGEHLYTYNSAERDFLVKSGWKEEPSTIKVLPVSATEGVAIYRVYNPNGGGTHMYTQNPAEVQFLLTNGWKEGKVVFKTAASTATDAVPVYRLKNPNSKNGEHQFTTSAAERAMLLNASWGDEGIAFYSFK